MKRTTFTVSLPEAVRKTLDERGQATGQSPSEIIRRGLDLILEFDPAILAMVRRYAAALQITEGQVIQNIVAERLADYKARFEVFGPSMKSLGEFIFEGDELISGAKLFEHKKQKYIKQYEREKAEMFRQDLKVGVVDAESQAWLAAYEQRTVSETDESFLNRFADQDQRKMAEEVLRRTREMNAMSMGPADDH